MKFLLVFLFVSLPCFAALPERPTDADHPSSATYSFQVKKESLSFRGRKVDVFLPVGNREKVPVILFGHGQAIGLDGYQATLEHLAKKGFAVIFPQFDTGFFDQDWRRMAGDFQAQSEAAIAEYSSIIDSKQVVYAGHSKGGYIALMAAGLTGQAISAQAVVLFAPAGFDNEYLRRMNPNLPITLVWGEKDTVISKSSVEDIYSRSPSKYKQFIEVKSYPELSADHFFPLNKSFFFGGRNGLSAFHFFATWPWIIGAAQDVQTGSHLDNLYLYGDKTNDTGMPNLKHTVKRSW